MGKSSIQGVTGKRAFPDGVNPDGLVKIERVQSLCFSLILCVCHVHFVTLYTSEKLAVVKYAYIHILYSAVNPCKPF